jgi:four helix bundle protein
MRDQGPERNGALHANEIRSFRDLIAWQKGMDIVCSAYRETKSLPTDERFGLISQMRRSAVSIPSNIAEGWGRHEGAEYIRFLEIARGSTYELATQAEICIRLGLEGEWEKLLEDCEEVGRILHGLMLAVQRTLK